ncbi:MAG: glycosyltransferase [Thermodesulfobacteriota bacterium]|nr:glycosyltransferase [Thermodesulfobacteriota bacterium]
MNVLQVTKGAVMRGIERHTLTLLEGFKDRPVNMSLAVFTEGPLSAAARKLGVDVYVVQKRYRGDIAPLLKLIRLIKTKQIDIVHTHLISGNLYGRLAGKATRVKGVVSTIHYSDKQALGPFSLPLMEDLFFKLDISMAFLSDRIVTPSAGLKHLLIKQGIKEDKIVSIHNAVNLDHLQISEEDIRTCRQRLGFPLDVKLVGMVGRLVPVKNFGLFLKAARRVIDSGIRAKFILIGNGPLRSELQKMVVKLCLTEQVIFMGFREDVFQVVSILDLFVLCSNWETFPLAIIEAMALKRPVIATKVGGVPEIIDHMVNGWFCPPGDEVSLANSIIHLLGDEEKAIELGNRAHQKVMTNFNLRTMTDKLLKVYCELAH